MQAGMYPQAIALLQKEIKENPTNAEAHFQMGVCYVNQNIYSSADERFASAVRLNSDYGYKIGTEYKKAGEYNLRKGRLSSISSLYNKAIEYDPSLKKEIAQKIYQDGKQNNNDQLLSLAISYDRSLSTEIADYYYSLSQRSHGEDIISMLEKATEYDSKYRIKLDDKKYSFLEMAKQLSKVYGKEKEAKEYKQKAIKYLGKGTVEKSLPEYKIYNTGEYTFTLKAGEQTDHWIAFPVGTYNFGIKSEDDKFKLLYDDGEEVPAWTPGSWPNKKNSKFKVIAVDDQPVIKMTLKEIK
jgi:tetratricopeptide (TPR) repeat protein